MICGNLLSTCRTFLRFPKHKIQSNRVTRRLSSLIRPRSIWKIGKFSHQDWVQMNWKCIDWTLQTSRYKLYMTTVISDNLRDAQRGGVPSTYNLVSAFVGLKFNNQNTNSFIGKIKKNFCDFLFQFNRMYPNQVCRMVLWMASLCGR